MVNLRSTCTRRSEQLPLARARDSDYVLASRFRSGTAEFAILNRVFLRTLRPVKSREEDMEIEGIHIAVAVLVECLYTIPRRLGITWRIVQTAETKLKPDEVHQVYKLDHSTLVMPDEGFGNVGQRPLQIVLERRTVPDYDINRVVVVFNDPAAVKLLGFLRFLVKRCRRAVPP